MIFGFLASSMVSGQASQPMWDPERGPMTCGPRYYASAAGTGAFQQKAIPTEGDPGRGGHSELCTYYLPEVGTTLNLGTEQEEAVGQGSVI